MVSTAGGDGRVAAQVGGAGDVVGHRQGGVHPDPGRGRVELGLVQAQQVDPRLDPHSEADAGTDCYAYHGPKRQQLLLDRLERLNGLFGGRAGELHQTTERNGGPGTAPDR